MSYQAVKEARQQSKSEFAQLRAAMVARAVRAAQDRAKQGAPALSRSGHNSRIEPK